MNMRYLIIVCLLFLGFNLSARPEVNYQHKSLLKALQKAGVGDWSYVEEFSCGDSTKSNEADGKFFCIHTDNEKNYKYIYVGRVNSCRAGGCSNPDISHSNELSSEYFDYFIIYDETKKVREVNVFNYQATHGYEVSAKGWLKQFNGHDGSKTLRVDKNIDSISGATISVYAITADITYRTKKLTELQSN